MKAPEVIKKSNTPYDVADRIVLELSTIFEKNFPDQTFKVFLKENFDIEECNGKYNDACSIKIIDECNRLLKICEFGKYPDLNIIKMSLLFTFQMCNSIYDPTRRREEAWHLACRASDELGVARGMSWGFDDFANAKGEIEEKFRSSQREIFSKNGAHGAGTRHEPLTRLRDWTLLQYQALKIEHKKEWEVAEKSRPTLKAYKPLFATVAAEKLKSQVIERGRLTAVNPNLTDGGAQKTIAGWIGKSIKAQENKPV